MSNMTGVLMRGVLIRHQGECAQKKAMWGHKEEAAVSKPRTEASQETKLTNTFILDFYPPEFEKKNSDV